MLPARRAASVLLLVLFLFAPYASAFFQLRQSDEPTCGMVCCKRSKVCCCRKPGRDVHVSGAVWQAASTCAPGCGQLPATRASAAASLKFVRFEASPVVLAARVYPPPTPRRPSLHVAFALFERPPPALSLAQA